MWFLHHCSTQSHVSVRKIWGCTVALELLSNGVASACDSSASESTSWHHDACFAKPRQSPYSTQWHDQIKKNKTKKTLSSTISEKVKCGNEDLSEWRNEWLASLNLWIWAWFTSWVWWALNGSFWIRWFPDVQSYSFIGRLPSHAQLHMQIKQNTHNSVNVTHQKPSAKHPPTQPPPSQA